MSWLSDLFGGKKQSFQQGTLEVPQTYASVPTGQKLQTQNISAMEEIDRGPEGYGQWIGLPKSWVERTTNPAIASREARWGRYEQPAIESTMAARGLGRSTIAGNEIAQQYAQKERDINEMMARAYQEQVGAQREDVSRYQSMADQIARADLSQRTQAAQMETDKARQQVNWEQARDQRNQNLLLGTAGLGVSALTGMFGGGAGLGGLLGGMVGGLGGGQNVSPYQPATGMGGSGVNIDYLSAMRPETYMPQGYGAFPGAPTSIAPEMVSDAYRNTQNINRMSELASPFTKRKTTGPALNY